MTTQRSLDLREQVVPIFTKFAQQSSTDDDVNVDQPSFILSRHLPAMLDEFQHQRGHPVIESRALPQLQAFVKDNPDISITVDYLVQLIVGLEAALSPRRNDSAFPPPSRDTTPPTPSHGRAFPTPSYDSSATSSSDDEDDKANVLKGKGKQRPITWMRPRLSGGSSPGTSPVPDDSAFSFPRNSSPRNSSFSQFDSPTPRSPGFQLDSPLAEETGSRSSSMHRIVAEHKQKINGLQEEHEETMLEMQKKVDDLKKEHQALKKESKEQKNRERDLLEQATAFESEISRLQKQLDAHKGSFTKLKKEYENQCVAADKMRDALREKVETLQARDEHIEELSTQARDWENAKQEADRTIKRLREELEAFSEVETAFTEQQIEVSALNETIERLRFELEEARESSSGPMSRGDSNPASMSRRLGSELALHMAMTDYVDSNSDSETDATEDPDNNTGDDFVETVIRRRRRLRRKNAELVSVGMQTGPVEHSDDHSGDASTSTITGTSLSTTTAETSVLTIHTESSPPTYNEAAAEQRILARTHPALTQPQTPISRLATTSLHEEVLHIQHALGVRCILLERLAEEHVAREIPMVSTAMVANTQASPLSFKDRLRKKVTSITSNTIGRFLSATGLVDVNTKTVFPCAVMFGVGVVAGSKLIPMERHLHHFGKVVEDEGYFQSMNMIPPPFGIGADYYGEEAGMGSWISQLFRTTAPSARFVPT